MTSNPEQLRRTNDVSTDSEVESCHVVEDPKLAKSGARWFHTADRHSPTLAKASLGEFFSIVLKEGAQIGTIWPFNIKYSRSAVYVTVFMTEEIKDSIEAQTRFQFVDPPKISLS